MVKSADQWFQEYGVSHQNPTNKLIHAVCVPLIMVSVLALIAEMPRPVWMDAIPFLNWASLLVAASMIFYLRLSVPLALGMLAFSIAVLIGLREYSRMNISPLWQAALVMFVVAWIGQFIGHMIEGRKPSFVQDLKFLLIGPVWLLGFVYRRLGIRY